MFLKSTLALTLAAGLILAGCSKKSGADAYLDQMDQAVTEAGNLIKDKKPKTMQELEALPEWKAIDAKGKVASDSLQAMESKLTPEQKKRMDDIMKRAMDLASQMPSPAAAPSNPSAPTTPPAGGDSAASAAPSNPAPSNTTTPSTAADTPAVQLNKNDTTSK